MSDEQREFAIEAVTDAAWTQFGTDPVPIFGVARALAEHDLAVVKPALLFGDAVTLRSGNFLQLTFYTAFERQLYMPQRLVWLLAFMSRGQTRQQLHDLGLTGADLPREEDAAAVLSAWYDAAHREVDGRSFLDTIVLPAAERWDHCFERFVEVVEVALNGSKADLFSQELVPAVESGVLEVRAHTDDGPNPHATVGDLLGGERPLEYRERSLDAVIERLKDPMITPLLDPWAAEVARQEDLLDGTALRAFATSFGVHLLAGTPRVSRATVAEILDIRCEIEDELVNFRSAMYDAAESFLESERDSPESWLFDYSNRTIRPALSEIDRAIHANTYIRELIDTVSDPREFLGAAGGLIIAAALGTGGIGAVLAGALGVSAPVARAALARSKELRDAQSHRLFLLYRLNEDLIP